MSRSPEPHARPTRRDLLRVGGLGMLGLSAADAARAEAVSTSKVRSVLLIQHYGGPSHLDLWDPKPHAPVEIRGEFASIATSLPGVRVTERLPRIARLLDRMTVIRTMSHATGNHNPASYLALTGRAGSTDAVAVGATNADWPALGSVVAKYGPGAPAEGGLPPFVSLPHVAFDQVYKCPGQTAGILGKAHDPLILDRDPSGRDFGVPELRLPSGVSARRLDDRRALLAAVDAQRRGLDASAAGLDALYGRAYDLLTSAATRKAFDLSAEDPKLRDRYGRHKVGQSYLLSRRLVEAGVRFVTCFNGSNPGDPAGWDTHAENFPKLKDILCPPDDQAFSALIEDMDARGLLETTLVIWSGEFGRKPQIGKVGVTGMNFPGGRDHWPQCYSIALAGGGIKRGYGHGQSDPFGAYPATEPVSPADIAATILFALGIDPESTMTDPLGRPSPLAAGRPVRALFE